MTMPSLRSSFILGYCAVAGFLLATQAGAQTLKQEQAVTGIIDSPKSASDVFIPVQFAGDLVSRGLAEALVEPFGWVLADYHVCGGNSGECLGLTVVKKNGNVFRYSIAAERCIKDKLSGSLAQTGTIRKPDHTLQGARAGTKARRNNNTTGSSTSLPRDYCIGGWVTLGRIRQLNIVDATPDAQLVRFTHTLETPGASGWETGPTLSSADWRWGLVLPPGGHYEGWSYEVTDEQGKIIGSDSQEWHEIAGSDDTSASVEARCDARLKMLGSQLGAGATIPNDFCKLIEPDVVVVGPVEWEVKFCETYQNAWQAEIDKARAEFMDACLANPDLVLTQTDPNASVLDLAELITFKTPYGVEGVPSGCSDFTAGGVSVDMGDGQVCTADVRFGCTTDTKGVCTCEAEAVVSETIECTDTSP